MKQWLLALIVVVTWTFAPAQGAADAGDVVSVDVSGESSLKANDPKVQALDVAFSHAVRRVTEGLTVGKLSVAQRRGIQHQIYRRARRYIRSYALRNRELGEGRLRVTITARVDSGKIREVLSSLGVGKEEPAPAVAARGRARPKVIVVASHANPQGVEPSSSSGRSGAVERTVTELGFEVAKRSGATPVSASAGELPLGDGEVAQLAASAGAGGAFVVAVKARGDGAIRATRQVGAVASAIVRVVDAATASKVVEGRASAAGYGADAGTAERRAGAEAVRLAMSKVRRRLDSYWPVSRDTGDDIAVVISGLRTERALGAIERHLASSRAKISITGRRLRLGFVQWSVASSLSARRLAALLSSVPMSAGSIRARVKSAKRIEVRVRDFAGGS